jgi:pimeloyl-ACP methyl ester carboxylesterase
MKTVYLIHGFNVRDDGAGTTDLLAPLFEDAGLRVKQLDYGYFERVRVRLCNDSMARVIATTLIPNSLVVAHSNGCDVVYRAAKHGAIFQRAVLINPALDADKAIDNAKQVQVWYSPSDSWTRLARFIPRSNWGNQGCVGYKGNDARYANFNEDVIFNSTVGHSGVFKHDYMLRAIFNHAMAGI